ncbi:MAG: dihydroneopterin aldolase [Deltaproteobacteria bacterium]|nr:MAG: dihydroneopterin aldolase [Deltaproteobacteria bacterium]
MDTIELTSFRVDTIIGLLDAEQRLSQPIDVEIAMDLPLEPTASTGDLTQSIDYAAVQAWFTTLAQQGKWRLLESLAMATCRLLLAPPGPGEARAQLHAVRLSIRKPTILDGAVPGVRVAREAAWCDLKERELSAGVTIGTLEKTPVQGAWRITLEPGAVFSVPPTWSLHVIGGQGTRDGRPFGYREVSARMPSQEIRAGEAGMTLLAVGAG